jgi:uroporphyrin-III C-methyltransferase
MAAANPPLGKVILAGAGPGDPELMTLKTWRYLKEADVIITDRLVSQELFPERIKEGAIILYVGKQGGKDESISQKKINELLIEHASQNKLVLRLKGGDVSFFSNILDELKTLAEHNIPYEIIPGVTAGSGAAAYAGIPLTARGYATSVRFLTCYNPDSISAALWAELAATDDTLVFYMSSEILKAVVVNLLHHKISTDKELAIIEQATTPFQKVHIHALTEFAARDTVKYASPTLVIIGRVVSLYEQFKWLENSLSNENYFYDLEKLSST